MGLITVEIPAVAGRSAGKFQFSWETGAGTISYQNGTRIEVLEYGQGCKAIGCSGCVWRCDALRIVQAPGKYGYNEVGHCESGHGVWMRFEPFRF